MLDYFHTGQLKRRSVQPAFGCCSRWPDVSLWQVQRESAAFGRGAAQLNFAAQQACQFAADGQTQPGASVLAAGAGICLLKCLEDDSLFFVRNSNSRVRYFEGNDRCCLRKNRMIFTPPP